jgi:hypothetical protein
MGFWNSTQITNIYTGATANDGTGDPIRDAFNKVDLNFANISAQLGQFNQDWTNANIEYNLYANFANISNLFVANSTGVNSNFSGTITATNLIATSGLYSEGTFYTGNIVPTAVGTYNLGSPTRPFANLYVQNTVSTNQINQSSDSGMLLVHANSAGNMDVGILGNVTDSDIDSDYVGPIEFAFFGYQLASDAFVYKLTPTNPMSGNSIVYDGIYGNTHFGSQLLSDTTVSTTSNTGALIVAGGVGIGGNLNVAGNITQCGYNVLTTNTPGLNVSNVNLINNNVTITGTNPSVSTSTGALVLSYGGLGVAGNINAGGNVSAAGFVGPLYGTVMTAAQPNITSVGTLSSLNVGSASATSIGVTNLTVGSTLNMSGAALTNLNTLTVGTLTTTANTTSGNVIATGFYFANGAPFVSSNYGNTQVSAYIPTNPTIYTLQANVGAYETWANATFATGTALQTLNANIGAFEITTNANIGGHQLYIASINANLGAYQIYANANIGTIFNNLNTLTANVGAFQQPTSANIGTQFNNLNTLTANVGAYEIWANTSINSLRTNANANTAAYLTQFNGNIIPSANLTYNIGSTTVWWNNIYGTAIHAQYADLAERYLADNDYAPGTVVVFGGEQEITVTEELGDERVAGAISTDPAYLMNDQSEGLAVALRGKVPVKLFGPVTKGDSLVTHYKAGYAISVGRDRTYGQAVFAKSLETNLDPGEKIIMAVII